MTNRITEPTCPTCPHCGSDHAIRTSDAILPSDDYSERDSGIFRCGHCRNEYIWLQLIVEVFFSPTAQCPACKGYKTRVVKTGKAVRYNICLSHHCLKPFRTLRPPNERQSRQVDRN